MAVKRNRRRGSWLQRNTKSGKRKRLAGSIKFHRLEHFGQYGYKTNRNLASLGRELALNNSSFFDLKSRIGRRLPKKGRLYILDSGAGFLGVSADLKKAFGNKVFVTSLGLASPRMPYSNGGKLWNLITESTKKNAKIEERPDLKPTRRGVKKQAMELMKAAENAKLVDERRVSPIETFSTRKRYNVIMDFFGPLEYAPNATRVLEKYFTLLKPNGSVIASMHAKNIERAKEAISSSFGKNNTLAKKRGYYLSIKHIPKTHYTVHEIKKIPL